MRSLLLATQNLLGDAGMTVLIGLVVVFAALAVLTFVFWLFGVVNRAGGQSEVSVPADTVSTPTPPAAPVVDGEVPDEVVAVIAAAIAAMSDGTTRYTVRRVTPARQKGVRPVWAAAGIAENTCPF